MTIPARTRSACMTSPPARPVLSLEPRDDQADVMVFSPDGRRLFTGFGRGTGIVWDVRRGEDGAGVK